MRKAITPKTLVGEDTTYVKLLKKGRVRDPDFPLGVIRITQDTDAALHVHDFSELVIVTHGKGIHRTSVGDYPIATGNVFLAPSDTPHGFSSVSELSLLNIMFDTDVLLPQPLDLVKIPGYQSLFIDEPQLREKKRYEAYLSLGGGELAHTISLVEELRLELKKDEPGWRFRSLALFMLLLDWLGRHYAANPPDRGKHLMRLRKVLSHIENHLTEQLSVDDLCLIANMSRSAFYQHFIAAIGCSPVEYILELRITLAAQLLRETEKSVTEVAFESGFNHLSYFAKKFCGIMTVTPSQYRSMHR